MMELFAKIVNGFPPLAVFIKRSKVLLGSECGSNMRQVLVSDAFITNCESSTWILRKYVGKGNWITFAVSSSTIVLWGICPGRKYFHIFIFKNAMSKAPKLIIKDWTFLYLWWNERGCLLWYWEFKQSFKKTSRLFKHGCIILPWFKILLLEWLYCKK